MLRDRWAALWASLLISLGGNSTFFDRLDPVSGLPLDTVLHVPFQVLSLGTAQSLGWLLFLPCLCLTHLAYRRSSAGLAIASGVLLGAPLPLAHAHVRQRRGRTARLPRPGERCRAAAGSPIRCLAGSAWASRRPSSSPWSRRMPRLSFAHVVALGAVALGATFLVDPHKRFYLWSYAAAGVVALPYLLELARHTRELALVQDAWASVQMMAVGLTGCLLFFAAYLVSAVVALLRYRERDVLVWLSALLVATGFLALNQYWHWYNHPYRFTIDLIFPLAILAALALRHGPPIARVGARPVARGRVCLGRGGFRRRLADPRQDPFGRARARGVSPGRSGRDTAARGNRAAHPGARGAHLPARPRPGHDADELLARAGLRSRTTGTSSGASATTTASACSASSSRATRTTTTPSADTRARKTSTPIHRSSRSATRG